MDIIARTAITLTSSARTIVTATATLPPTTDRIVILIDRPTTSGPSVVWAAGSQLETLIVVTVDGVEHRYAGTVSGGIRTGPAGEAAQYRLEVELPWGFFGQRSGSTRRLGQTAQTSFTARVEARLGRGANVSTFIRATTTESDAPVVPFRSSVAFDTASSAYEGSGDGIVSVSHTAAGSDRAAFIGVSIAHSGNSTGTVTYGGSAATSLFEDDSTQIGVSGFYFIAPPASAQTVTSDLVATAPFSHVIHVITMTGVDQTTPCGTPVVVTAGFDASPSVTVGSVGADDLVVDVMSCTLANSGVTIGASQTQRTIVDNTGNPDSQRTSTQPGASGGVMSWTLSGSTWRALGAVAFKPSAGVPEWIPEPAHIRQAVNRASLH